MDLNDDDVDKYAAMEAVAIAANEDFDEVAQLKVVEDSESKPNFEGDYKAHLKITLAER